jgi:hypothetical protein
MVASWSVCGADRYKSRETAAVHAFWVGFGLGFVVALQLGPVSLYQIRTTLRNGLAVGLAFAAGIALVDLAYAALGARPASRRCSPSGPWRRSWACSGPPCWSSSA